MTQTDLTGLVPPQPTGGPGVSAPRTEQAAPRTEQAGPRTEQAGPRTEQAGPAQAAVLLGASSLSIMGAVLIAPVQPAIRDAFPHQAGAGALVPIALTVPALTIALLAPFAGRVVDRVGRLQLLVAALVVYAAFGTAPLWLPTLPLVVASRVGVGVAEAAIMTCCTTLLADLWSGARRDRILGLQVVVASLGAVLFIGLGGALGSSSWRTPFALYGVSLVFAVLVPVVLRSTDTGARVAGALPEVDWARLRLPCITTVFGGIIFYAPVVELSFKLDHIGITATATIGALSAVAAIATTLGALAFGRVAARGPQTLLPVAFGVAAVGLVVLGLGQAVPAVAVGAVLASAAAGLLLPTLLTWAVSPLTAEQRGRGTGAWTACVFIGQFVCPLALLAIGAVLGGLDGALVLLGILSAVAAAVVRRALRAPAALPA